VAVHDPEILSGSTIGLYPGPLRKQLFNLRVFQDRAPPQQLPQLP